MVAQSFLGILSDKIGRRNSMLLFSGRMAIVIYSVMVTGMCALNDSPILCLCDYDAGELLLL